MKFLARWPLLQALRDANSVDSKLFFFAVGVVIVFLFSMFFSSDLQRLVMQKFHWRARPFGVWSVLQFVPSMYSFSNEIVVTQERVDLPLDLVSFDQIHSQFYFHVNHFPLRLITFNPKARAFFLESQQNYYVYLRSRYRGVMLDTVYQMNSDGAVLRLKNVTP